MSRMTAAQVIGLGEYLDPDFDAAKLTVSQLLGIFGFHNIPYPQPHTKSKLVQLFNEQIKANSAKLKRQRVKTENSVASDEGITNGHTGKPLSERSEPARRSSRRLSRAPSEDSSPPRPEPPKRRRSSAQPELGGTSTRRTAPMLEATVAEESEPEEEDIIPIRRVKPKKADLDVETKLRRASDVFAEDSGWEDNNVFQSGAESSSPARPSPVKTRNPKPASKAKTTVRRSRKASSAPPQVPSSPEKSDNADSPHRLKVGLRPPPDTLQYATKLDDLSPDTERRLMAIPSMVKEEDEAAVDRETSPLAVTDNRFSFAPTIDEPVQEPSDGDMDEDQNAVIAQRIADGPKALVRRSTSQETRNVSWMTRLALLLILAASSGLVYDYKSQSTVLGYCDTNSNTNNAVEDRRLRIQAVEACNRENSTVLALPPPADTSNPVVAGGESSDEPDVIPCPPLPLIPTAPLDCTPCPSHAQCTRHTVTCDTGYFLRPHWLFSLLPPPPQTDSLAGSPLDSSFDLAWKLINAAGDGLPGLGSVAFPPRCVEDPRRKRNIGALGGAVAAVLGQERGLRLCSGTVSDLEVRPEEGGEAKKWGVEIESLKDTMKRKTAPHLLPTFDDTFDEAIHQLKLWGNILTGEDQEGHSYLAHEAADLTWNCAVTVKARETWTEWRSSVYGVLALIITAFVGRMRRAQRKVEDKRVAELVQVALDALQSQERTHYADPVLAPYPYLSSAQLRDAVLQDVHSVSARTKLWSRVEQVVEGNANVRVNLEEVAGGDEERVWRWVGGGGGGARHKMLPAE